MTRTLLKTIFTLLPALLLAGPNWGLADAALPQWRLGA
jgi:hypothetical protein